MLRPLFGFQQEKHIISCDITVVDCLSHRVAVMLASGIVEIGIRAALFENTWRLFAKRLIPAMPVTKPE